MYYQEFTPDDNTNWEFNATVSETELVTLLQKAATLSSIAHLIVEDGKIRIIAQNADEVMRYTGTTDDIKQENGILEAAINLSGLPADINTTEGYADLTVTNKPNGDGETNTTATISTETTSITLDVIEEGLDPGELNREYDVEITADNTQFDSLFRLFSKSLTNADTGTVTRMTAAGGDLLIEGLKTNPTNLQMACMMANVDGEAAATEYDTELIDTATDLIDTNQEVTIEFGYDELLKITGENTKIHIAPRVTDRDGLFLDTDGFERVNTDIDIGETL
jgi:hypothetical protein